MLRPANRRVQPANFRVPPAYRRMQSANCQVQPANRRVQPANRRVQPANRRLLVCVCAAMCAFHSCCRLTHGAVVADVVVVVMRKFRVIS